MYIYIYCDLQPSCTTAAGGTLFPVTLLLSQQFCVNVPYDPHYGRPGADLRRKSAPVCNNNETTAHQHCGAVTKSMSNCIRAAALQQ